MKILFLTLAVLLGAAPLAIAQQGSPDTWQDISVAEWRKMVQGRTVTYRIGDQIWAQEAYDSDSNGVAIRLADGTCMAGSWSHQNDTYCFAWLDTETSCFRHIREGDQILVIPVVDGAPSGTVQTVMGVTDLPLNCGPALSS